MRSDDVRQVTGWGPDDDAPLDPAASAALIAAQQARVAAETVVDGRLLFGAWGTAWLLGFGALWSAVGEPPLLRWPGSVAGPVFAALLVTAMAVTVVHVARRTAGVRGTSAVQGAMYGWAWFSGFVAVFALATALVRAGADDGVIRVAMTLVPALLVGALYMTGGAIWQDRTFFALGAWIVLVTVVAAFAGVPGMFAVMAVAGGGGMLVAALTEHARRHRRPVEPAAASRVPATTDPSAPGTF